METSGRARGLMRAGIVLLIVAGFIHVIESPEYFEEATYLGELFIVNGIIAAIAAFGIYRGTRSWG